MYRVDDENSQLMGLRMSWEKAQFDQPGKESMIYKYYILSNKTIFLKDVNIFYSSKENFLF